MKAFIPIAIAAIVFSSCSTAYQSGQTPDDVYYSPQRPSSPASQNEYVSMEKNNSKRYQYNDDEYSYDDAYLRMKVRNRNRWAMLDNDFYFYNASPFAYYNPYRYNYNPYAYRYYGDVYYSHYGLNNPYFGSYGGFGFYYNPYYSNPYYSHYGSYYYNPYGAPVIIVDKNNRRTPVYSRPRTTNLNIYNRPNNGNNRSRRVYVEQNNSRPSYNGNRNNNAGNNLRNVFGNNDRSSNNTPSRPSVNTPSSSNSSSNSPARSSGGGGNAPTRRF